MTHGNLGWGAFINLTRNYLLVKKKAGYGSFNRFMKHKYADEYIGASVRMSFYDKQINNP